MDESRIQKMQRFSRIWCKSRADAGKSQEYMAMGLGVSKKTIQNWEKGVSSPNLFQSAEWFELLGLNPLTYYLAFIYPWLFDTLSTESDDQNIEEILVTLIKDSTPKEKRELLYLMIGDHGSSWYSLLQMFTAHCHTTMKSRVAASRIILENFEMEKELGLLVCKENVMPDMQMLKYSISQGKNAVENNNYGYSTLKYDSTKQ